MTTVSVCATACFLSASQPVSNAAARRARSPSLGALGRRGGRSLLSTCLRTGLESAAAGGDRAVCLPPAAESLVLRVATQLPELGSAAPQRWAPRAPRRHALALKAKLQRLAGAERRAAASGPRASQATRRQPVSRFSSTQARTVRQMSKIARPAIKGDSVKTLAKLRRPIPVDPTAPKPQPSKRRRRTRPSSALGTAAADVKDVAPARHRRGPAARHGFETRAVIRR